MSLEEIPDWVICGEATTGRQAAELARRLRPDVAVLDLSMPELNGLEAAKIIRQDNPDTEVLIFTMHQSAELIREIQAVGARGYILKSDPPEVLQLAVRSVAQHIPYITRGVGHASQEGSQRDPPSVLTAREREIVQLVAEGLRTREIANHLGISEKTVESHRSAVMRKLHIDTVVDMVRYAIRNNIVQA